MSILQTALHKFGAVPQCELSGFESINRMETKYIIHQSDLASILSQVKHHYRIIEVQEKRLLTEKALYFDTEDKQFYRDHFNANRMRLKVCMRQNVDFETCYLEVERKWPDGNTRTTRVKVPQIEQCFSERNYKIIKNIGKINETLVPSLLYQFNRFTLVSDLLEERVTLDVNLRLPGHNTNSRFGDFVVIEIRQEIAARQSPIMKALQTLRHHPSHLGKYCIGILTLDSKLRAW